MIEFQYFEGCPNSNETLRNLRDLISEGIISESDIIVKKMEDMESAEAAHFLGSPTVLINGVDIYTGIAPRGFSYSCRVYEFDGVRTGVIPKSFFKAQIIKLYVKRKNHWEGVYSTKAIDAVSWFQKHPETSLRLIKSTGQPTAAAIIDIGGGASTLVDDLLSSGYSNITVLDISAAALRAVQHRVGARSNEVTWMEADITEAGLPSSTFDIWHDRALFHFLVSQDDRRAYVESLLNSVKPGGHIIIAAFAEDGPTSCSGLPVMRYRADELAAEFGDRVTVIESETEEHHTPFSTVQKFTYCLTQKRISL